MANIPVIQEPPLARGRTADVYEWRAGQVLKLFHDWVPDSWIQREAEISRMLSATTLPVPQLIEETPAAGRRGLVFERINGQSMVELLATRPSQAGRLARQMAELHAAINAEDGRALASLRDDLKATIGGTEHVPAGLKKDLLARLGRLPEADALCHFDFHPGQIMIAPNGPVALDWMAARKGDPAADVARTLVLLTYGELPDADPALRTAINLIRRSFQRDYVDRYLALRPEVTLARVSDWMVPVAAARLAENIGDEREPLLAYLGRALCPG